jgi:hypothetical protein
MSLRNLFYYYGPKNQDVKEHICAKAILPCYHITSNEPLLDINGYITVYNLHFSNACQAKNEQLVSKLLDLPREKYNINYNHCLNMALSSHELAAQVIYKAYSNKVGINFHVIDIGYTSFEMTEFICSKALQYAGQYMRIIESNISCEKLLYLSRTYDVDVYFTRLNPDYRKYLDEIEGIMGQLFPDDLVNHITFEFLR